MKSIAILCAALCVSTASISQHIVMNQHAIDESRYEGKDGNPYLFEEFAKAIATNSEKGKSVEYLINYNGHTNEFEFIHKGVKSEMDASYYDVIEVSDYIPSDDYSDKYVTPSIKFVRGLNPKSPKAFSIVVYEDEHAVLYKTFTAKISKREYNDPARGTVTLESFMPDFNYFVKIGSKTKSVGLNKKKVDSQLDHAQVSSYIKKNKLKVKDEEELVQVISYYAQVRAGETSDALPIASANN